METKFTPGPWRIQEAFNTVFTTSNPERQTGISIAIAKVLDEQLTNQYECSANGRLIAAAPELYEALKAVLEIETEEGASSAPSHTSSGKSGSIAWSVKAREVYSNAHAALAKARGEA